MVDDAEEKIEHYGKRMKLKGELVLFQDKSQSLAGEENGKGEGGLNIQGKRTFKS